MWTSKRISALCLCSECALLRTLTILVLCQKGTKIASFLCSYEGVKERPHLDQAYEYFRWLRCQGFVLLRIFGVLVALWLSFLPVYLLIMIYSQCLLSSELFRCGHLPLYIAVINVSLRWISILYCCLWISLCQLLLLLFIYYYYYFFHSTSCSYIWWSLSGCYNSKLHNFLLAHDLVGGPVFVRLAVIF